MSSNALAPEYTQLDFNRLLELEAVIERGMQTFVEVGNALLEIRDSRLYRKEHDTFEGYCNDRWGIGRAQAYRLISAAEVVENLSPMGDKLPHSERQARPLAGLPVSVQEEAWQRAVDTAPEGKVTARHVENTVQDMQRMPEYIDNPATWKTSAAYEELDPVPSRPHVSNNSGNNEWYTPRQYIEAARATMGSIDLDPASSLQANEIVQATRYFTTEDDGLEHEWPGNVWLNPPYAQPLIAQFADKLRIETDNGNVIQFCVLVNNATETKWFRAIAGCASLICFPSGRVRFWMDGGEVGAPLQGQAVLYYGDREDEFWNQFQEMGLVVGVQR